MGQRLCFSYQIIENIYYFSNHISIVFLIEFDNYKNFNNGKSTQGYSYFNNNVGIVIDDNEDNYWWKKLVISLKVLNIFYLKKIHNFFTELMFYFLSKYFTK